MSEHEEHGNRGLVSWRYFGVTLAAAAGALMFAAMLASVSDPPPVPGDLNCDGIVNADDIEPFVLAVNDSKTWCASFEHDLSYLLKIADFDHDDEVDLNDIPGFASAITQYLSIPDGEGSTMMSQSGGLVDLDIDSDNDDGTDPPARTDDEDLIEDDPFEPGKKIVIAASNRMPAVLEFDATGETALTELTFRLTFPDNVTVAVPEFYGHAEQSLDSREVVDYQSVAKVP